jgi:CBS domain-containing protein
MMLQDILRAKGAEVFCIASSANLEDVVQMLVARNCGSLVVADANAGGPLAGIITERDILRTTAATKQPLREIPVVEAMTRHVITASPHDSVEAVMGVLTEHRIRHLPVVEHDELVGMISIGDLVKAQVEELAMENHFLKNYIQG